MDAPGIADAILPCNQSAVQRIRLFATKERTAGRDQPERLLSRLAHDVGSRPRLPPGAELAAGVLAGLVAVAARYWLPLSPSQLPTITVVVALAVVTTFIGVTAGIATALVGGILSWYLFFNAFSWSLAGGAWVPLLGFAIIATVIVSTSYLYRSAVRQNHEREVARLQAQAAQSDLFASEMAHRLKNALAIVQSIAFQTIGTESEEASKFAGRLKTLADANDLLNEHVEMPSADVRDVVRTALSPFGEESFQIQAIEAAIPAQQVVSLALALHELATNAIKHGALSVPGGRVLISFSANQGALTMAWKERGGPRVSAPTRRGFGLRLLQRSGISPKLEFERDGLCCSIGLRAMPSEAS
jgi:two-component sensor histidine kinase